LLYADDVVLLAELAVNITDLLGVLALFSMLFGMRVNMSKTKAVVFTWPGVSQVRLASLQRTCAAWRYGGVPVPVEEQFTYLGLVFHQTKGCSVAPQLRADAGRKAAYALLEAAAARGVRQPAFLCRLFDSKVEPGMSYGCQIWAPGLHGCLTHAKVLDRARVPAEGVHYDFLRQLGGLPPSCHRWVLQAEFGRQPLLLRWLRLAARFYDRVVEAEGSMMHAALSESVEFWRQGDKGCWFAQLHAAALALGVPGVSAGDAQQCPSVAAALELPICEKAFEDAGAVFVRAFWRGEAAAAEPAAASSAQVVPSTYRQWVRGSPPLPGGGPAPHLRLFVSTRVSQAVTRLRVSNFPLRIMTGRYEPTKPSREQRTCRACKQPLVEDLPHFLLHCPCYTPVRQQYAQLFTQGATTASLLGAADQIEVAAAVWAMLQARQQVPERPAALL
jgi:hypothetical protein